MADVDDDLLEEEGLEEGEEGDSGDGENKKQKIKTIGILAAAVLLGSAAGGVGLGPRLAAGDSGDEQAAEEEHAEEDDSGGHGGGHGGGESDITASFLTLENIVVNPAGTDGMRFVMVSFALKVDDPALEASLIERELEVRDVVSSTLERQTLDMLTSPHARDSLRVLVADAVAQFLPDGVDVRVLVPRFVIQ
jgi:flagellar FliL protein